MKNRDKNTSRNSPKPSKARRRRRRSKETYGIGFEHLEQRNLLAAVTVNTSADVVDGDIFSIQSLISSPGFDGEISLREAIIAADNTFGTDTITFDAATFNGEAADVIRLQSQLILQDSIVIDGGNLGVVVSGDTFGNDTLVADSFISDVEASELAGTFDDNTNGVFLLNGTFSQNASISGLTITGGNSSFNGGGVQTINSSNLTISHSTIAGNRAAASGGGIQAEAGSLTIDQSSIRGNVANNPNSFTLARGGGLASLFSTVTVSNSTISDNVSHGEASEGGGIDSIGSTLSLSNSTVTGNIASSPFAVTTRGGGVFIDGGNVSIASSTITDNTASAGGGIAMDPNGSVLDDFSLTSSIVAGNIGRDLVNNSSTTVNASFSLIGDNTGSGLNGSPTGGPDTDGNLIGTAANVIDPLLAQLADNGGPTLTHALLPSSPAIDAGSSTEPFDQRGSVRIAGNGADIGAFEQDGAIFTVDNSNAVFDGDFSSGQLTLVEAIDLANGTPGADTILFDPSVFNGEAQNVIYVGDTLRIFESVTIDAGDLDVVVSGDVQRDDALLPGTFISDIGAPNNNLFDNERVFEIIVSDQSTVTFRGLTITGGNTDFGSGGGILSNRGALVVEDSVVSGNRADDFGGGIHASDGSVRIHHSSISTNLSQGFGGGGGGGVSIFSADLTIANSTISDNSSSGIGGGISSINGDGNVNITHSTVSNNSTRLDGGGIIVVTGDVVVEKSTISGNSVEFGVGGGIIADSGALDISNSTISGNESPFDGSGIHTASAEVTITDSTITKNQNNNDGAGIWVIPNPSGDSPQLTVRNSIVAGNFNSSSPAADLFFTFSEDFDITTSLIGSNRNISLSPAPIGSPDANGNLVGTEFEPIDPLLADLADNGGPTQTHALSASSPAIDAGNSLSTTDQRGELRTVDQPGIPNSSGGNSADIGAFEFEGLLLTVDSTNDAIDGDFTPGNLTLREAIMLSNDNPATDGIRFDPFVFDGQAEDVIRLQLGELLITDGVSIDAGDSRVVVSADRSGDDIVDPETFATNLPASAVSGSLTDNIGRVFNVVTALGESVIFSGLTITGGNVAEGGGGINVDLANLNLMNTSVLGNRSSGDGGGVLTNQALTLTGSTVSENIADNGSSGGGIAMTQAGTITLNNSTVSFNLGTSGGGGGIHSDSGDVIVENSAITGNAIIGDARGGGIYSLSGDVQITGSTVNENLSDLLGGGIFSENGAVNVNDSTISGNEALHAGGGIWASTGDIALSNSSLSDNATTNTGGTILDTPSGGGGIYSIFGSVSVSRSTISGNSTLAEFANGGAISAGSDVEIEFSTVSNNSTLGDNAIGGALATIGADITIRSSTLSSNSTSGDNASGGAVATIGGRVEVSSSTLSSNSTSGDNAIGGAITTNSRSISISFSTLNSNNTQGAGSIGGALATNSGGITTRSSTLSSNSTSGSNASGGALATRTGDITLTDSTITENSVEGVASFAGGVYIENNVSNIPFLRINNSIVAGNSAFVGNDILVDPSTTLDVNFSLIGDNTGTLLTPSTVSDANGNLIGSFAAVIDPMLAELSSNGGATQTHALLPGSPAIDAGSSTANRDQRLAVFVRPSGNADDIGAFELQTLNLVVDNDSDVVDGNFSSNNLSLREAITFANANPGEDFISFSPNAFRGFVFDAIHLTQGELEITESVTIVGADQRVVVTGDRNRDDINPSGTAITDLARTVDSRLDDNSGVFNITASAGHTITFNGLIITGGVADEGAGIRNEAADLVINETTIAGNRSLGNGGGIFNNLGSVTINGSTISGNQTVGDSTSGGGIHANIGAIELTSSTVSGNQATGLSANGGGISSTSGDLSLTSVTVTDNSADADGGGIFVSNSATNPRLTIDNTIVAANTANNNADLRFNSVAAIDISFSLIGDNSGTPLASAEVGAPDANGNLIGTNRIVIDPLLGDLADNGGLTLTHEPMPNSPVVDAGSNSTLATDQRNIPLLGRDDGDGVDIGAFELHQFFLVVDTSSDIDDGDLSAGNLSLREALALSNTNFSRDTITFDTSVFDGQLSDVIRLSSGSLTISDGDLIDGNGTNVVISGDTAGDDALIAGSFITDVFASNNFDTRSDNAARVFDITAAAGETVSIQGITITGSSGIDTFEDGGGIRNQDGDLVLTDVTVSGNRTSFSNDGGGVSTEEGTLTLNNSTVSDNFSDGDGGGVASSDGDIVLNDSFIERNVSDDHGGGIHFRRGVSLTLNNSYVRFNSVGRFADGGGIFASSADVTLNNSVVSSNTTEDFGDGGGIFASSGDVTLNNSSVNDNTAGLRSDGGGIGTNSGDVFVNQSTISGNQSGDGGGGISTSSGDVTLNESSLTNNTAGDDGGGVTTDSGDLFVNRSTISGNHSSGEGGGIETRSGEILVTNSTLSGNSSDTLGGAIYQNFADGTHIANSTIFDNQSNDGAGGIHIVDSFFRAELTIENSIVAGHTATDGTGADLSFDSEITIDIRNSIIGSNTGTSLQATAGSPDALGNRIGTSAAPIDPLLGDLADNGGPTLTHALLAGSPAINAGGSTLADVGTTDQRGEGRISEGQIDIGAYELESEFLLGDVNRDGLVTFLDIFPFINVLSANTFQAEADINLDGAVTFLDIAPFITLLSSQAVSGNSANLTAAFAQPLQLDLSPTPDDFSGPADLFDAQPELFDELQDFELDEVAEGLLV